MATTPKTMCTNIGGMERMLRVIAGIAILYMGPGLGLGMWSLIGIIPILTGSTGWCPVVHCLPSKSAVKTSGSWVRWWRRAGQ